MKIISKFKDYYDGVSYHPYDDSLIYVRETKVLKESEQFYFDSVRSDILKWGYFKVDFCGKVYVGVQFSTGEFCYSLKECDGVVENSALHKKDKERYFDKNRNFHRYNIKRNLNAAYSPKTDLLIENKSPCISTHINFNNNTRITLLNPCLKNVAFYRVFDSYQTYQEISMFLGNIAQPLKPIPKLDDKTMLEIKGFDKYSFRKEKSK